MPNTIDYRVLRRRFREAHGRDCRLSAGVIQELWTATRRSRATGAGVPRSVLEERAAETLVAMLEADARATPDGDLVAKAHASALELLEVYHHAALVILGRRTAPVMLGRRTANDDPEVDLVFLNANGWLKARGSPVRYVRSAAGWAATETETDDD